MPSLSASIFGFATDIAIADKIDVVTRKHAARLMKSRRRIGRPSFWLSAVCGTSAFRRRRLQSSREQITSYTGGHGLPVRRNSCPATCILAVKATRKRRPYANVRLILAVAIHIRGTNGRSQPPRPNGRELPKAE